MRAQDRLAAHERTEEHRTGVRARESKDYLIRNNLAKSAVPPRFESRTFDNYIAADDGSRTALATCRDYAVDFPERLQAEQFADPVRQRRDREDPPRLFDRQPRHPAARGFFGQVYMTVGRAFRSVKDTFRRDSGRAEQEVLSHFAAPELLILDEIGVQYGSDTEKNILFEIVNERYEALKPTILISNLARLALTEYAGERVIDRMKENGGRVVVFDWKSHRGAA